MAELEGLWKAIRADLARGRAAIEPVVADDPHVREYEEYLDENELELACDMLEAYAEDHAVTREFWLSLAAAATKMELHDRARRYSAEPG